MPQKLAAEESRVNEQRSDRPIIWTVGHSTRALAAFLELLESAAITLIGGVGRFPHYNQQPLSEALARVGIGYLALPTLDGSPAIARLSRERAARYHAGWPVAISENRIAAGRIRRYPSDTSDPLEHLR
jgi:hypothetical protein